MFKNLSQFFERSQRSSRYQPLDIESLLRQDPKIKDDIFIIFIPPELREHQNLGTVHFDGKDWGVGRPYHTSTHDELQITLAALESPRRDIFMQYKCYFPIGCERGGRLIYMVVDNRLVPV
ncbi:MAG: hypothetical protein ACKPI8_09190 [Microcystis panniformis]